MQTTSAAFTAEEKDAVRNVAHSLQVSWKKDFTASTSLFTIGVSTIGGVDIIAGPTGVQSAWNQFQYADESDNVMSLSYDQEFSLPLGGMVKGMADVTLDNTSGRYTPQYAGGSSEIFTAVLPRRPFIINTGFVVDGSDYTLPQFVGITQRQFEIDRRAATAKFHGEDFVSFLQNAFVDRTEMFTSVRSDEVMSTLLSRAGFSTAQYDLDYGVNNVGFVMFNNGDKMGDVINKLTEAENGHFYQDEDGTLRFENRQHWNTLPYTQVQRVITTSDVINSKVPDTTNLINVVEVTASPRDVFSTEKLIGMGDGSALGVTTLPVGDTEVWVNYDDPVFQITAPVRNGSVGQTSYFVANTLSDGSGTDTTTSVTLSKIDTFAQATKFTFTNSYSTTVYLTTLDVWGRAARKTGDIYYREKVGHSITAFEEHILKINNDYIQDASWAASFAGMVLEDFATPDKLIEITIKAMPDLQRGDLISWQGRYWRIFGILTKLSPGEGFIQELKMVKKDPYSYFRIGVSTIGGHDVMAP